jgi:AcrR family transcriptional regulator
MAGKTRTARAAKAARPYHHGDLRRTLLDAALAIVREAGAGALSLRELARAAGVSHAAPYRHFASREALLVALATEGFAGLGAAMAARADGVTDPLARFTALGVGYVCYAVEHPGHFRIMFSRELHEGIEDPGLAEAGEPTLRALVDTVAAGQAAGVVRAGDPRALAVPAWSIVHDLAMLLVDRQLYALFAEELDPEAEARAVIDVVARGLAPTSSSSRTPSASRASSSKAPSSSRGSSSRAPSPSRTPSSPKRPPS